MWKKALMEVEKQSREHGIAMQPPASENDVKSVVKGAEEILGVKLPNEYLKFLRLVNGLNWNGVFIYGSRTNQIAGTTYSLQGINEANEIWRDYEGHKKYLFFGDSDMSLYGQDLNTGEYKELDRSSNSLIQTYKGFDDMLTDVLKLSLL
jgi:cell wall assembly regulator SMI1